ncbi:hypothetical protein COOONC_06225 [Cooperia oncophora]
MKTMVGEQGINISGTAANTPTTPQNAVPKAPVTQQQSTGHMGNSYVTFMRGCTEQLRQIVTDEVWVNTLFEATVMLHLCSHRLWEMPQLPYQTSQIANVYEIALRLTAGFCGKIDFLEPYRGNGPGPNM